MKQMTHLQAAIYLLKPLFHNAQQRHFKHQSGIGADLFGFVFVFVGEFWGHEYAPFAACAHQGQGDLVALNQAVDAKCGGLAALDWAVKYLTCQVLTVVMTHNCINERGIVDRTFL